MHTKCVCGKFIFRHTKGQLVEPYSIASFYSTYLISLLSFRPGQNRNEKCNVCISRVKDIEEAVWSPRWGTKGKVDLTVEVKVGYARGAKLRVNPDCPGKLPIIYWGILVMVKRTISSQSEQTFNRAWNQCPSLR